MSINEILSNPDDIYFFNLPFWGNDNKLVVLDPTILATFCYDTILNISDKFNLRDNLLECYNKYVFEESLSILTKLKLKKCTYKKLILKNGSGYKENIFILDNYNLFVVYFCSYKNDIEDINDRIKYIETTIKNNTENINVFHLVLNDFNTFFLVDVSIYKPLVLHPFELKCIYINENFRIK